MSTDEIDSYDTQVRDGMRAEYLFDLVMAQHKELMNLVRDKALEIKKNTGTSAPLIETTPYQNKGGSDKKYRDMSIEVKACSRPFGNTGMLPNYLPYEFKQRYVHDDKTKRPYYKDGWTLTLSKVDTLARVKMNQDKNRITDAFFMFTRDFRWQTALNKWEREHHALEYFTRGSRKKSDKGEWMTHTSYFRLIPTDIFPLVTIMKPPFQYDKVIVK